MQKRVSIKEYWMIPIVSMTMAVGLNIVILCSGLTNLSPTYQEAAKTLYMPPFWQQILLNGILVPVIEEFLFRAGVMRILRKWVSFIPAMILSALVFGIYHGNLVQFVYGTLCGLMLAYLYEIYGTIKASITAHISMNLIACILTETGVLTWILNSMFRAVIVAVLMALIFVVLLVMLRKKSKNWLLQNC